MLLENGARVNAEGGQYGNALQAASFRGNEAIVKLLLGNEAEVNATGGEYGNALQAASFISDEAIVKILSGHRNVHQVAEASYQCKVAIVKLLLKNGAEVNAMKVGFLTIKV